MAALGPNVYAYVGHEQGKAGQRVHFHALIGGLFVGHRDGAGLYFRDLAVSRAVAAWTLPNIGVQRHYKTHGNIEVHNYDPRRGASWYVAKYPNEGDIMGELKPHRRRTPSRATRLPK